MGFIMKEAELLDSVAELKDADYSKNPKLGDIYKRLHMWEQAFECWNNALELDTEITSPMWAKAMCYEELGDFQNAYQTWLEIIAWLEARGYEDELKEPRNRAKECKSKI